LSTQSTEQNTPWLYTDLERQRRDSSPWTLVQGVLAPLQFVIFLISLYLVINYVATGAGETAASVSVIIKTITLLTIMVTGCFWEKAVFNRWLFAHAFFWEDVVSMGVIALHLLYVVMYFSDIGSVTLQLQVALVAYAAYLVNALQFIYKFRIARLTAVKKL